MASLHAPLSGPSNDRYRQALIASGIGAAILDLQGRWLEVNPAFERALGYSAADLNGRPVDDFIHPDDRERARQVLDALGSGGGDTPASLDKRLLRRGGDVVWTAASIAVLRGEHGAPDSLLLQLREVEHRPLADAPAEDPAQKQLQLFADAVAHDLRAPLRSIESFAALLEQRAGAALDENAQGYLTRIRAAAGRMGGLLGALGSLSRATRADLRPAAVDISLLADWIGAELQDAHADVPFELAVQPGLRARGDERLLKLMLEQLLDNAVKFSRGHPPGRVEVDGGVADGRLRLTVRDHGSGFDMRYAHKLFQPFQRLHGPDNGGGHGLGLAIAQTVARRHGGRIEAQADTDGSLFTVELPAAVEACDA